MSLVKCNISHLPLAPIPVGAISAIGKPRMALFLSMKTRLVPLGFHMIRLTETAFGPCDANSFRGKSMTQAPFGDHMKTRVYPVPMLSYWLCGANLKDFTACRWIKTVASSSFPISHTKTAFGIVSHFVAMKRESKLHSICLMPVGGPARPT